MASSLKMFYGDGELTGGNGTTYSGNTVDSSGAVVDSDDDAGYLTVKDEDYNVKYVVCLFGINVNTYSTDNGATTDTAGLTFGPALGYDVVSYSHLTESEFKSGDYGICLHWMTWEEIVIQSAIDPTAFQECLEDGCTHSVEINLNNTLLNSDYNGKTYGDGTPVLYSCINSGYLTWNSSWSTGVSNYASSRIRATLIGKNSDTDSSTAGSDTLTTSTCLFSCFPEVLREAIVAKDVKCYTYNGSVDCYDKLWLFSVFELNSSNYSSEGPAYQYGVSNLAGYKEDGNDVSYWTRSMHTGGSSGLIFFIYNYPIGSVNNTLYDAQFGLAPGFCIP